MIESEKPTMLLFGIIEFLLFVVWMIFSIKLNSLNSELSNYFDITEFNFLNAINILGYDHLKPLSYFSFAVILIIVSIAISIYLFKIKLETPYFSIILYILNGLIAILTFIFIDNPILRMFLIAIAGTTLIMFAYVKNN